MRIHLLTILLAVTLGPAFVCHAHAESGDVAVAPGPVPVIECDEPVWTFLHGAFAGSPPVWCPSCRTKRSKIFFYRLIQKVLTER